MRHRLLRCLAAGAAAAALFLALPLAAAGAQVLVNAPNTPITLGQNIKAGVWYQSDSGGPHWAKIAVLRHNKVLWTRSVKAVASHWKYYTYRPSHTGTYVLRYKTASGTVKFLVHVTS